MRIYSPNTMTSREAAEYHRDFDKLVTEMNVSDESIAAYLSISARRYREILSKLYPDAATALPYYTMTAVRLGPNAVITAYRPAETETVEVLPLEAIKPPLAPNVIEIAKRFQANFVRADMRIRSYSAEEAELEATNDAMKVLLNEFWNTIEPRRFEQLCLELLNAEGIHVNHTEVDSSSGDMRIDATAIVEIGEPAGFRRDENWAFEFKHQRADRVSLSEIRERAAKLNQSSTEIDVACLVTSAEVTSVASHEALSNRSIRIWDRPVLENLILAHAERLGDYLGKFRGDLQSLTESVVTQPESLCDQYSARLSSIPPGNDAYGDYESLGVEMLTFALSSDVKEPTPQSRTMDGKQRRDVVFPIRSNKSFFEKIARRFNADVLVVDFKNFTEALTPEVIDEVAKYANKAIGKFLIVVSRKGIASSAIATQLRQYRDNDIAIIVLTDEHLVELVSRKERDQAPEDLLADLLDELLLRY